MNKQTEKLREGMARLGFQYAYLIDDKEIKQRWYDLANRERWFDLADQILQACRKAGLVFIVGSLGASHPHLANYFSVEEIDIE